MANPRKDHAGERYGKLTAVRFSHIEGRKTYWVFKCDCGKIATKSLCHVMSLDTKSCGCNTAAFIAEARTTHGGTGTRLYKIWTGIRERCYSLKSMNYQNYGGRGITVCYEWRDNFQAFLDWSMSTGYRDNLSIDRIDNSKGYAPDNCRWATMKEQANNRRNTVFIKYKGELRPLMSVSDFTGVKRSTLRYRIAQGRAVTE